MLLPNRHRNKKKNFNPETKLQRGPGRGYALPSITSKMPPITKRGCCTDTDRVSEPTLALEPAGGLRCAPSMPILKPKPKLKLIGRVVSTGRGSIKSNPCRSIAFSSQRHRSSLSAISTADGRRRTIISDERPRRTAQGRMLTLWAVMLCPWLLLWCSGREGVSVSMSRSPFGMAVVTVVLG